MLMIHVAALLIVMTGQASARYYWSPQDFGVEPQFIQTCRFFRTGEERSNGRALPVGLTPLQFDYAINEVYKRMLMSDMDHVPGRSVTELAELIKVNTEAEMKRLGIDHDKPELLRKWLLIEGVCAWVSTHVVADKNLETASGHEQLVRGQPSEILKMKVPSAICGGYNWLTKDLANAVGISTKGLGGEHRSLGATASGNANHGWNYFDFGGGVEAVADCTEGRVDLAKARTSGNTVSESILPLSPADWEYFLASHYSTQLIGEVDWVAGGAHYQDTNDQAMTKMSYSAWIRVDTSSLGTAAGRHHDAQVEKVSYLNSFKTLPRQ